MPGLKIINSVRAEHTRAKNKKPISHRGHKGHRGYRENRHRGVSASSFRDGAIRFCTGGSRGPFGYPAMNHKVGVPSQRTRLKSGSCFLLLGNATLQCGMSCVFFHFKNRRTCQLKSWRSQHFQRHRGVSVSSFRDGAIRFCTGGSRGPLGYPAMNHKVGVPSISRKYAELKFGVLSVFKGIASSQKGKRRIRYFFYFCFSSILFSHAHVQAGLYRV